MMLWNGVFCGYRDRVNAEMVVKMRRVRIELAANAIKSSRRSNRKLKSIQGPHSRRQHKERNVQSVLEMSA
jgi:hypothetical protein